MLGQKHTIHKRKYPEGTTILAQYNAYENKIYVADDVSPSSFQTLLLHELLHSMFFHSTLRGKLKKNLEEDIVSVLEVGIRSFFKENPKIVRQWLKEFS